ncbi:estradiol 17-beta-dehydrogenase 11-like [Mizuhopecten yessoensis]|uniref:Short-chain dehydrogenase/reductase 3 n=1 Tax=Mizuhopecten yessoensis TaxID=6573 RepID=A0A210PQU5_MIZYE|nr:estradiol 17-beta-dehydrogenase 11-like [Mizuhopecten yessoensis]OWF38863.1 Estradiol 17-beta-dehydrogenase 11 [Mizuhopecten yessoensis]
MASKDKLMLLLKLPFYMIYFYLEAFVRSVFLRPSPKDVKGDVVLVTGAGHGIGREIALEFGRLGARVVLWDINKSGNDSVAAEIKAAGGEAHPYVCDLCKTDDIKTVAASVKSNVGNVDILVNNAGILYGGEMLKMREEHIRRTFEVNTLSHFWTTREFLPAMIKKKKGHIVTTSSMSAKSGTALLVDYSSSKYAAYGFAEAMEEEMDRLGHSYIKFTTVCPMFVSSGLVKATTDVDEKMLTPKEVALATVNGTLMNRAVVTIPDHLAFSLRVAAWFPRKLNLWLKKVGNLGIQPQYTPSKQD